MLNELWPRHSSACLLAPTRTNSRPHGHLECPRAHGGGGIPGDVLFRCRVSDANAVRLARGARAACGAAEAAQPANGASALRSRLELRIGAAAMTGPDRGQRMAARLVPGQDLGAPDGNDVLDETGFHFAACVADGAAAKVRGLQVRGGARHAEGDLRDAWPRHALKQGIVSARCVRVVLCIGQCIVLHKTSTN